MASHVPLAGATLPSRERTRRQGTRGEVALTKAASHALSAFRLDGNRINETTTMHRYRSHTCGALRASDIDKDVRLSGWCHRIRDHGGVLFIDLRDHYGLTQVVADPDSPAFKVAETLRSEWVVRIDGKVRRRPEGTVNPELPTGEVEIYIREIEVLGRAGELPMPVFGEQDYPEDIRLRYRFLDLRREHLHRNIMKRGEIIDSLRRRMKAQGFFEFQTPILTASSPEGARDYLVPSRLHPGKFYALPQAPQQFKQLIMISGFDRYFQIAPCFRDEDARADRSPGEFYQLDLEMSFVTQEDVFDAVEPVIRGVFEEFGDGKAVTQKFPRIPYSEAISKYGVDKPDLRNPIVMQNVSEIFRGSGFKIFARILDAGSKTAVWAIPAPRGGSRAFCDRMNSWAQGEGQPGLGYIFFRRAPLPEEALSSLDHPLRKIADNQSFSPLADAAAASPDQLAFGRVQWTDYIAGTGPVANNLGPERTERLRAHLRLNDGDAVFFVAGEPQAFVKFAGAARTKIGEDLGLIDKSRFELCWIVDFPMYEWNDEEKKIDFSHNPFSMPNLPADEFLALDAGDNEKILGLKAIQYDIVCNGVELSSGAIRNHRPDVMKKAFAIAGYDESVLEQKFGGMLHALSLGAPPHGGIAPGIDRIVMLLCGEENLREVVLFPMNQRAEDLLMGAPSEVSPKQLRELHIRVVPPGPGREGA
jgi:aspartyl-tRNA synthetase